MVCHTHLKYRKSNFDFQNCIFEPISDDSERLGWMVREGRKKDRFAEPSLWHGVIRELQLCRREKSLPHQLLSTIVGWQCCYRAVITKRGHVINDCGFEQGAVINDCGFKPPLVIELNPRCYRATTARHIIFPHRKFKNTPLVQI